MIFRDESDDRIRRGEFQTLVRELVDWRLAEYLDRADQPDANRFVCTVRHAPGGTMLLELPSRRDAPSVPSGLVEVFVDEDKYVADFANDAVSVFQRGAGSGQNSLPELLVDWFGPEAGKPGTHFQVAFECHGGLYRLLPVGPRAAPAGRIEMWRHYMRERIPPLFGLTFTPAVWNQGFIVAGNHLFLLVTLEKRAMLKDHRYEERFLSGDVFQWQSQNTTRQDSRHGQLIQCHRDLGFDVHLFVRRRKALNGKGAPFVYCGPVDFICWEGEAPISVQWKLKEPAPAKMRQELLVPEPSS